MVIISGCARICVRSVTTTGAVKMPKAKKDKGKVEDSKPKASAQQNDPVYTTSSGTVAIRVHAKPGASESRITDIGTDGVGVQIAAPPMDGEANAELVRFLAKVLNLRKSDVSLEKGSRSKDKVVMIASPATAAEILSLLQQKVGS
ncbi:UPF0235 protein C15orf40 homolog [Ixodes scapularis]|nr:UPF0235 protein C15orf40 homolog [Ixodes scapularis]